MMLEDTLENPVAGQALAIHVEDSVDWQDQVKSYITRRGALQFQEFITCESIDDRVFSHLRAFPGPIIILMDLRLGEGFNYSGYHWLLEEYEAFLRRHASTILFVISGELNPGIIETLVRRGIPASHIIDKGSWPGQRDSFIRILKENLNKLETISTENMLKGSNKRIDSYLLHSFNEMEEHAKGDATESDTHAGDAVQQLPMVVLAKSNSWHPTGVPDLRVLGHIDNLYSCLGSARSVAKLEQDPEVLGIEASRPWDSSECDTSLPFIKVGGVHNHRDERGDRSIVGIIDDGIDVLHKAFLDVSGSRTRIVTVWDQADDSGRAPIIEGRPTFGTEYHSDQINDILAGKSLIPSALSLKASEHGTHVASIACGRATDHFAGGVAPEAKIILVIPKPELNYTASHHLALQYIKERAQMMQLPVVINVSQGVNAGAHDGTSFLETGFDRITNSGREPGIAIVKSAGNERDKRTHAHLTLTSFSSEALTWTSERADDGSGIRRPRDIVEIWYKSVDIFRFRLRNPSDEETEWVRRSNPNISGCFLSGNSYEMTLTSSHEDNGDSRLMIRIMSGKNLTIEGGTWTLEIESSEVKAGKMHAWIERTTARAIAFSNHIDENYTLTIPGTSHHVIAVGSVSAKSPSRLAGYSSFGPTRDNREKPDLCAPGEGIVAAKHGSGDNIIAKSGTSMAAPHVTGAIALLFSYWEKRFAQPNWKQFNAAQIQKAISQTTQNYTGNWHEGYGFGILDIEKFFKHLVG